MLDLGPASLFFTYYDTVKIFPSPARLFTFGRVFAIIGLPPPQAGALEEGDYGPFAAVSGDVPLD